MSTKIACCKLNRINLLILGFPDKKERVKNARKPESGIERYTTYKIDIPMRMGFVSI